MNLNNLTQEDKAQMEKFIAKNLESSLNRGNYECAKIHLEFYEEHIRQYKSQDLQRYCDLRNKYNKLIKWNGR
jgi:hypothetical protein